MGERTEYAPGTFCWVDLGTTDAEAAKGFYAGVFGWEYEDVPMADDFTYTLARRDGHVVAGLYDVSGIGMPAAWVSYVATDDIHVAVDRAKELGATILNGPVQAGPAGRLAVLADPTGAVFALWEAAERAGAALVNADGALTMNQLNSADPDASQRFYEQLFLWQFNELPTGGGPDFWSVLNDNKLNAGMMPLPDEAAGTPSHWLAYFAVGDLNDAEGRVSDGAGDVVVDQTQVPAGRFLVARDPQGAYFALFEGELDP
jgi:predicted enzyme related to lactoylglutathione lyase